MLFIVLLMFCIDEFIDVTAELVTQKLLDTFCKQVFNELILALSFQHTVLRLINDMLHIVLLIFCIDVFIDATAELVTQKLLDTF